MPKYKKLIYSGLALQIPYVYLTLIVYCLNTGIWIGDLFTAVLSAIGLFLIGAGTVYRKSPSSNIQAGIIGLAFVLIGMYFGFFISASFCGDL